MEKWKKHAPKRMYKRESDREKEQDRRADRERALSLSLSFFERKSVSAKSALSELNYFYSGKGGSVLSVIKTVDSSIAPTLLPPFQSHARTFLSVVNCPAHCVAIFCVYAMYLNLLVIDLSRYMLSKLLALTIDCYSALLSLVG